MKFRGWRLVRLAVSAALIVYLAANIDWPRMRTVFRSAHAGMLLAAPPVFVLGQVFAAARWVILLRGFGIMLSPVRSYVFYLVSAFYGTFLPGVIGGDVVRIGMCARHTRAGLGRITLSVIIERASGVAALFILGGFGSVWISRYSLIRFDSVLMRSFQIALGLLAASALTAWFLLKRIPEDLDPGRHSRFKRTPILVLFNLKQLKPVQVAGILAASLGFQGFDILSSYLFARGLNLELPVAYFMILFPIVYLATVLPISIGGLGVREGVLAYFLTRAGIELSDAVTFSFLVYMNRIILAVIGGMVQIGDRTGTRFRLEEPEINRNPAV